VVGIVRVFDFINEDCGDDMKIIENAENDLKYKTKSNIIQIVSQKHANYFYVFSEIPNNEYLLQIVNISTNRQLHVILEDSEYSKTNSTSDIVYQLVGIIRELRDKYPHYFIRNNRYFCKTCRKLFYKSNQEVSTARYVGYNIGYCDVACFRKRGGENKVKYIVLSEFYKLFKEQTDFEDYVYNKFESETERVLELEQDAGECALNPKTNVWELLLHDEEIIEEYIQKISNNLKACLNTGVSMEEFVYMFLNLK